MEEEKFVLRVPEGPTAIVIQTIKEGKEGILFTIKADGTIIKGPHWTTSNEAAKEFLNSLEEIVNFKLGVK